MTQYKTGTASVTNNSPTVTGTNTLWLANVSAADSFTIAGDGVMYDVASVDSDTQITLSAPYAGTTASGVVYAIGTGFTVPDNFPEMSQGDIETATIFTRAMRKIQGKISSILAGGANANFTAMPQVGGDPIVESGSNADGEWTRWSDGTQICTDTVTLNSVVTARIISATWTFPVSFSSTSYSIAHLPYQGLGSDASNVDVASRGMAFYIGASTDSVDLRNGSVSGDTYTSGDFITTKATANGRWK